MGALGIANLLALLALGLASAGAPVALAHGAQTARAADETPAQQAVTLDSPAVVRIVSVVQARLTCSGCASDGSNIVSPATSSDPITYFSSGSGAFISPTGAILTATHVVDHSINNPEDVDFVEQQASQDISTRFNATADTVLSYLRNNPNNVSIEFTTTFQRTFLSTAYTGNLTSVSSIYGFDVSQIVASSPVAKQDTAIIKINTSGVSPAPDFPYLTLSSQRVQNLDTVTAIAFPADADLALNNSDFTALADPTSSDVNTLTSLLSPSVNPGSVTNANEVRSDGTPVYEATGIGSNGSSGGPVINAQGQVIGFVDAGPQTNRLTFIIPSTVVANYATQAGVGNPTPGRFMTLWSKAVSDYYAAGTCHYTNATLDFATLGKQYPQFDGAKQLADDARLKAAGESCATGGASTAGATGDVTAGFLIIGGCLLAVLALIAGVIFLVVALARRKPKPAKVMTPFAQAPLYAPPAQAAAPPPILYRQQDGPVYPPAIAAPPAQPVMQPPMQAPAFPPQTQQAPSSPYVGAAQAPQPILSAPLGPTRFCPQGHVVLESDATFCPTCGALMADATDAQTH